MRFSPPPYGGGGWGVRLLLFLLLLVTACDDLTDRDNTGNGNNGFGVEAGTAEIYILNEGLFNLNNSTLSRYSFRNGELIPDYFRQVNRRGLGDTANDMAVYGSKLYIVVNASSQIEVVDLYTGNSLKQIPLLAENGSSRQPRYIAFDEGKTYVCSFDGTVARIDTASLAIDGLTKAGRNPDGICVQNRKLYVTNSGGLDWEGMGVDNTVSVIDLATFTETKKIEVGPNPGRIQATENGFIYVATRGTNIEEGDYHFVQIDSRTDQVVRTYKEKVFNFAINDNLAYLCNFNYRTQTSSVKVFNLQTGQTERENFITDGTEIHTPYCITVNPYNGNIYITDAYDYKVKGDVLCFNPQGQLQFRINNVGINPNTIVFSDKASQGNGGSSEEDNSAAFASKVWEYVPAPCQYMNTTTTAYKDGYTAQQVLEYATQRIKDKSMLSLGGFGGYIVLGFNRPIQNVPGAYDFKIYGNAYYDMYGTATGALGGSSEPGIVLVSQDANGNGLPDDEWYELAGSEYGSNKETRDYEITYFRPNPQDGNVRWKDNQGKEGYVLRNTYHQQGSYYPAWMADEITFRGTRLADNAVDEGKNGGQHWVSYCYPWGYADNHPNNTDLCQFKIDWAVDKSGKQVHLESIDFVKIYTAVNQDCGWMGEASTEVTTVEDLHYNK
ncbi:DUF5074 domain-containing protein [Bacteroides sp.]